MTFPVFQKHPRRMAGGNHDPGLRGAVRTPRSQPSACGKPGLAWPCGKCRDGGPERWGWGGVGVGPRSVETPRLEACSVRPVARTTMSGHSIPKNAQSTCTWQVSDPLSSVILAVTFPATEETPTAYGVAGNELLDLHLGHRLCRSCRGHEETMGHGNLRGPEALGGEAASPGPSALWAEARGAPPAWAPLCPMARFPL